MKAMLNLLFGAALMTLSLGGLAQDVEELRQFDSNAQKQLYKELTDELRCPKCQNQNIADSNANIAKDLRNKVYKLVKDGSSKDDVIDYMVERYGYFVYYKPPLTAGTIVLWLLPILFVLFTLLLIWVKSKRSREKVETGQWSEQQEQRLNQLIEQLNHPQER